MNRDSNSNWRDGIYNKGFMVGRYGDWSVFGASSPALSGIEAMSCATWKISFNQLARPMLPKPPSWSFSSDWWPKDTPISLTPSCCTRQICNSLPHTSLNWLEYLQPVKSDSQIVKSMGAVIVFLSHPSPTKLSRKLEVLPTRKRQESLYNPENAVLPPHNYS